MIGKAAKRQMNLKCLATLICLVMVGNLVHGTVLCFGADGHVKIESAFHERCDDDGHCDDDPDNLLIQAHCPEDHHCEPCVDIPVTIGLAKTIHPFKQLNLTFIGQTAHLTAAPVNVDSSAFWPVLHELAFTSYFSPLRTVILLA